MPTGLARVIAYCVPDLRWMSEGRSGRSPEQDDSGHHRQMQAVQVAGEPELCLGQHSAKRRDELPRLDAEEVRRRGLELLQRRSEQLHASTGLPLHERL